MTHSSSPSGVCRRQHWGAMCRLPAKSWKGPQRVCAIRDDETGRRVVLRLHQCVGGRNCFCSSKIRLNLFFSKNSFYSFSCHKLSRRCFSLFVWCVFLQLDVCEEAGNICFWWKIKCFSFKRAQRASLSSCHLLSQHQHLLSLLTNTPQSVLLKQGSSGVCFPPDSHSDMRCVNRHCDVEGRCFYVQPGPPVRVLDVSVTSQQHWRWLPHKHRQVWLLWSLSAHDASSCFIQGAGTDPTIRHYHHT